MLEQLTLVGTPLADPASPGVTPFTLPGLLNLGPGVQQLLLQDVAVVTPSCAMLAAYQAAACAAQPSAVQQVGAGWLYTRELYLQLPAPAACNVTVLRVNLTCDGLADSSAAARPPPCVATTAGTTQELAAAMTALAAPSVAGAAGPLPPAYIVLTSNLSLADGSGWPLSGSVPVTRNLTLAGLTYGLRPAATQQQGGGQLLAQAQVGWLQAVAESPAPARIHGGLTCTAVAWRASLYYYLLLGTSG